MSNTNTNSIEFDVVPCTDVPETLPETVEAPQTEAPAPKQKKAACRIFSLLLIAVSVAALFLPVQVLKGFAPESATLFASITDLFGGNEASKLFGMLPVYTDAANVAGLLAGVVFYALLAAIALTVVFGLIALISGKACLFRTAAFFFATGFGTYAVCGYALPAIKGTATELDLITVAIAAVGALLYLVLGFAKKGKKAFASLIQLLFTLVFVAATVMAFNGYTAEITTAVEGFGLTIDLTVQIVAAVIWVVALLGAIRLLTKKGLALDMIRYIVQLVVGGVLCYVAFTAKAEDNMLLIYAIVAAAVSLVQIVFCILQGKSGKKANKVEEEVAPVEQPAPEPVPEYTVEEYAEALPYEGGPVEGVEIAQEVNPTFEENPIEPVQVNTAGYDFYNSKSFDPFIAILNGEERNQFTELFILKYKGVMPEIPDYQVGGDNKEFFRKLFIYLGQYRDRIPDGLLAKIYQFAIRNA
ncbi:MAG: hypothetical protein J6B56_05880 [Clostridia bacterium]|nr:hypothetical protein [Clostridia bacterium]